MSHREELRDFIAQAEHFRAEHDATHGEAEMCGAECIVLGLAEFAPEGDGLAALVKRLIAEYEEDNRRPPSFVTIGLLREAIGED